MPGAVTVFPEKSGGKGLIIQSISGETRALDKYFGIFIDYTSFSLGKLCKNTEAQG